MTVDVEQRVIALADRLDTGDADQLVAAVMQRTGAPPRVAPVRRQSRLHAGLALATAAALVIVLLAVPTTRHAVAGWFGIGNTRIERPSPAPAPTTPVTFPVALDLGPPVSDDEAFEATGLRPPGSAALGSPVGTFVVRPPESGQIVVVYPPSDRLPASDVAGIGALLSVTPGSLDDGLFVKIAAGGTVVSEFDLDLGDRVVPAIWLSGEPHQYAFEADDGTVVFDTLRLATNTLLWVDRGVVHRLESGLDRVAAADIAATVTSR